MVSYIIIAMKRTFNEIEGSYEASSKSKESANLLNAPVFKITQGPPLSNLANNQRVMASSKVNFSKLSPEEQRLRYINQKKKVRQLKKTLDELENGSISLEKDLNNDEQRLLIENLCKALIKGKLEPNSLGYNQICTVIRDVLQVPYAGTGYSISLPDKKLNISSIEYENYTKLPCSDIMLLKIIGRKETEPEDPLSLLQIFSGPRILTRTEEISREDSH